MIYVVLQKNMDVIKIKPNSEHMTCSVLPAVDQLIDIKQELDPAEFSFPTVKTETMVSCVLCYH